MSVLRNPLLASHSASRMAQVAPPDVAEGPMRLITDELRRALENAGITIQREDQERPWSYILRFMCLLVIAGLLDEARRLASGILMWHDS